MPLLRGMAVVGHPNPTLDSERPELPGGVARLADHKAACKERTQKALGLRIDPDAMMIGFVGRLTYEKGADLVM